MSLRWSPEQLDEYQLKQQRQQGVGYVDLLHHKKANQPDEGPESALQSKIEKWCVEHHFYFFHDRSRKQNAPGHPDLVIALKGRTLWLELKSKNGRLRPEQAKVITQLMYLGHEVYQIKSFRQFLKIVEEQTQCLNSLKGP